MKEARNVLDDIKQIIGDRLAKEGVSNQSQIVDDIALSLLERWSKSAVYFPVPASLLRPERNQEIQKYYDSGVHVKDLARTYDLTERTIRNIIKRK